MRRLLILALAVVSVSAGSAFAQQNTFSQMTGANATSPGAPYAPTPTVNSQLYYPQPPIPYTYLGYPQLSVCSRIPTSLTCSW